MRLDCIGRIARSVRVRAVLEAHALLPTACFCVRPLHMHTHAVSPSDVGFACAHHNVVCMLLLLCFVYTAIRIMYALQMCGECPRGPDGDRGPDGYAGADGKNGDIGPPGAYIRTLSLKYDVSRQRSCLHSSQNSASAVPGSARYLC